MTPWTSSIAESRNRVAAGEWKAVDVLQAYLDRIDDEGNRLNAFLSIDREGAFQQAEAVDRARAAGANLGPLAGVPVGLKDNICQKGRPLTCGSKILGDYRSLFDADVVTRLYAAGAVIVGKLNLDEFAMGSSTENSAFGPVRNPWCIDRVPGGSSGGAAAATAAGLIGGAFGSDTGGSVRQPAAFCGLTAIKPTFGRVSRYGLVAYASSLDQIGPFGRRVQDAARLFQVTAGHDPRDATSASHTVDDYEAACEANPQGLRVGVVRDQLAEGNEPAVVACVEDAIRVLREGGCEVVETTTPHAHLAVSAYYLIAASEASSNLARFDGMRYGHRVAGESLLDTYERTRGEGFGAEVKRRIMLGTYSLSAGYYDAFYLKAQRVRTLVRRDFDAAFDYCDLVLTPTAPTVAFRLGEKVDNPLSMYLADIYTLPPSLAGLPAISTPCGFSREDDLPVGVQLIAPPFEERRLMSAANVIERALYPVARIPERRGPS